jgi:ribonuclease HII
VAVPCGEPWEAELTDSKAISAKKRERLSGCVRARWLWALGEASVAEIDTLNIRNATFLAMRRALAELMPKLPVAEWHVAVDGNALIPDITLPQTAIVGGDAKVREISAASIVAKVYRDALMAELDVAFPGYGWAKNAGYGTAVHMQGLATLGVTPHHRTSFAPVAEAMSESAPNAVRDVIRHAA